MAVAGWVSVAEATRIIQPETDDDKATMIACLEAAVDLALDFIQTDLLQQVTTEVYDGTNSSRLLLRRGPINSVSNVTIMEGVPTPAFTIQPTVIPAGNILFDDKFLTLRGYRFWRGQSNVTVTYDAGYVVEEQTGYNLMPASVRRAVCYIAKAMATVGVFDFNTSGENSMGAYAAQYLVNSLGGIPPSAQVLLMPYVRRAVS